jgi:hypothetical protein
MKLQGRRASPESEVPVDSLDLFQSTNLDSFEGVETGPNHRVRTSCSKSQMV